ncbi:PLDc N-terminal domain-containing protein [Chloroflexota bacterium]
MSNNMDPEWILRIILFGIVHWILAGVLLHDLASRQKVFGRHKPPWAIVILIIPCFGSLMYLLFHPQILNPDYQQKECHCGKHKK